MVVSCILPKLSNQVNILFAKMTALTTVHLNHSVFWGVVCFAQLSLSDSPFSNIGWFPSAALRVPQGRAMRFILDY